MDKKIELITDPVYGYLRVNPVPTAEEVNKYYRDEFYAQVKNFNDSALHVQQEEADFFNSRWEQIVAVCRKHFSRVEGLSAFDIGFGFAQALLYFRKNGMKVSGLEPSREAVAYARAQGLEVFESNIEDIGCTGGRKFDLVTVINVLEHLREPAQMLLSVREKLLNTGGLLVLDVANEFNDFQVAADQEYHLGQWWLCPPNHINYFSVTSLSRLLNQCGYRVVERIASFPLEMLMLMGDVYVGHPETGKTCHAKRVLFERLMKKHGKEEKLARLYKALADLDLGRQVVLYATPEP